MAEFQTVARAYVRMCESYPTCEGCPINEHGNDIDTCRCCVLKWPCKYESKIMSWAAEHQKPEYPTWMEWLTSVGAIPKVISWDEPLIEAVYDAIQEHIPEETAQKLGIEPKEG